MSRLNPVVEESLLHRFFSRPAAVLLSIHLLLLSTLLLASWPGGNTAPAIIYGD